MASDAERMARAGEYVLGRMSERERERAERDLETDERFRAAVIAVAERMRYFGSGRNDPAKAAAAEAMWTGLAQRLAAMPHMQGTSFGPTPSPRAPKLVVSAQAEGRRKGDAARVQAGTSFWRRIADRLFAPGRGRFRRSQSMPQAAAVLDAPLVGSCAIVEVHAQGRLRLVLLGEWALGPNEQLSLWGLRDDGASERIGGFGQSIGQVWFTASAGARHTGFQLGRESISFVPAARLSGTPLAEGAVKMVAGAAGGQAAAVPSSLSATAR